MVWSHRIPSRQVGNHGCFYWNDGDSFAAKFDELSAEHAGKNRWFQVWWFYFAVSDVNTPSNDDADIDISYLFR